MRLQAFVCLAWASERELAFQMKICDEGKSGLNFTTSLFRGDNKSSSFHENTTTYENTSSFPRNFVRQAFIVILGVICSPNFIVPLRPTLGKTVTPKGRLFSLF